MRPDFKNFRGFGLSSLLHSAKGSVWEEHKYLKVVNGNYYYPDNYEGGRHISSLSTSSKTPVIKLARKTDSSSSSTSSKTPVIKLARKNDSSATNEATSTGSTQNGSLSSEDVETLALKVIRGDYKNGQERKELLGEYYQVVQNRVNELMKGSIGETKVSKVSNTSNAEEKVKEIVEKTAESMSKATDSSSSSSTSKGLDYETIFGVYRNRK